jgi:hypothetical protein
MSLSAGLKSFWRLLLILKNFHVYVSAREWARQTQSLVNQFAAIQHDIQDGKYGDFDGEKRKIASDIQRTNGMLSGLWEAMKKDLKIEEDK